MVIHIELKDSLSGQSWRWKIKFTYTFQQFVMLPKRSADQKSSVDLQIINKSAEGLIPDANLTIVIGFVLLRIVLLGILFVNYLLSTSLWACFRLLLVWLSKSLSLARDSIF